MNKSLRKILALSSSALLLTGVGASATSATSSVHASRVSRLESRRARDYRDIKSINAQLSKLTHKRVRRHAKRHARKPARKRVVRRHHSNIKPYTSRWYSKYATKLQNKYGDSDMYSYGEDDASSNGADGSMSSNPDKYTNKYYKMGWIVSDPIEYGSWVNAPTPANGGSTEAYDNAIHAYNAGVHYIKTHHSHSMIYYHRNSNAWNTHDDD